MELNFDSFSSKLYRWFYNTSVMPSNLCPYFWKLVWMYLVIVPYCLLSLPIILSDDWDIKRSRVSSGILCYSLLFFIGCIIYFIFTINKFNSENGFQITGLILTVCLIPITIYFGISKLISFIKNKKRYKHPKNKSIILEFIKARYNKYCPKITWK